MKTYLVITLVLYGISCDTSNPVTGNVMDTVTDIDGNVYTPIKIGNQVWTIENLRVTRYNDGTAIPFDTATATWANATTPKFCYYGNTTNKDSIGKFGALYNWYVVDPKNSKHIAPAGWHVPSDDEWYTLQKYLIANGYNWDKTTTGNRIAKSLASKTDWNTHTEAGTIGTDPEKNNMSGFTALPGGFRAHNGTFNSIGEEAYWWRTEEYSASMAEYVSLSYGFDNLNWWFIDKSWGFSIRLIRNN